MNIPFANYLSYLPWMYFVFLFKNKIIYIFYNFNIYFLNLMSRYKKANFPPICNLEISKYGPETYNFPRGVCYVGFFINQK